jgi:flagellar biosynthesis protein FliR
MFFDVPAGVWVDLTSNLGAWFLVFARVLGLCLPAPGLSVSGLDFRFRLGLAALLATALVPTVGDWILLPTGWWSAPWTGLSELLVGGLLGLAAALIVGGARLAGDLISAQAGLSSITLFRSETDEELTPFGQLYGLVALMVFVMLDGPLLLVRALVESYDVVPAGRLLFSQQTAGLTFEEVARALELALRAAAPPALALVFSGIVVGWLSRAARSIPFVALALPVRCLLGMTLVFLCLGSLAVTLSRAWDSLLSH